MPSMSRENPKQPPFADAPEEPAVVQRSDGLRHLPPVRARAFLGLVRAGEQLARQLDAELRAAHGLSLRAFEILLHLAVFAPEGSLRLTELARQAPLNRVPLSQSRVSRLVAELQAKGLVTCAEAEADRRGVVASLTDEGLELFRRAQETHLEGLQRLFFSRLDWQEVTALADITAKLVENGEDGD